MKEVLFILIQQKEKEKELYEKLISMKQQIQFYTPPMLDIPSFSGNGDSTEPGSESIEKDAHTERIKDILGCYYTQIN